MKTKKFFLALATLMVCAASAFISCSSDDDNNNSSKEAGDKAVASLKALLLDDEGNPVFGETNEQGLYQIGFENQNDATKQVGKYVNNAGYAGDATIYPLPDERGTVRVEKGAKDGIYYQVKFAVKDIPQMTLEVVDANYMENENALKTLTRYQCNNCNLIFKLPNMAAKKCTSCSSTNIEKAN
ncbi:MAG: hypothetical protein IJP75_03555 [Bacteroidaceae bacterium]|nr:hypothetical protein [Bacteroidaceae bacterium]